MEAAFPFKIEAVQTDNGTEFTYRYISEEKECPFETALREAGIEHRLIPPRTPWHNGKVERSHRNDQRYFYDWERFGDVDELNHKLREHLEWSNKAWYIAALVSWGIALFEYLLQVPANRIGATALSLAQLKIMQEVITLLVFVPFVVLYMKQPIKLDYLWAALCMLGAVYFIFRN